MDFWWMRTAAITPIPRIAKVTPRFETMESMAKRWFANWSKSENHDRVWSESALDIYPAHIGFGIAGAGGCTGRQSFLQVDKIFCR